LLLLLLFCFVFLVCETLVREINGEGN